MKTEITLSDDLFRKAEQYAKAHGISRDKLIQTAICEFVAKKPKYREHDITQKLNELCDTTDFALSPIIQSAAKRTLTNSEW
jgi:predicted transcriptional regulator